MAYTFSVSTLPATGAVAIYTLKTTLVTAGWVVVASSDGTTYNSSGDQISGGNSGTGGFSNSLAWFRIKAPSVSGQVREFTFQQTSSIVNFQSALRIKYSPIAGFTGGSPSATQTPSATDEVIIAGGGTDASPSYQVLFNPDGTYRLHIAAGGSAEQYSFYIFNIDNGGSQTYGGICLDVMQVGSYPASDLDPAIVYYASNDGQVFSNSLRGSNARGFMGAISSANFLVVSAVTMNGFPSGLGSNAWTGKDDSIPIFYIRGTPNGGIKGWSTLFKYNGVPRALADTIDIVTSKDNLYVNGTLVAWNGSTPIL